MLYIDKMSTKPVYEQLIEGMERSILLGVYPEGTVLPSVRELSVTLGINPNTIQKSYAELTRRGIISPAPGSGCYVSPNAKARIREAAAEKLEQIRVLTSEMKLAGISEGEVLSVIRHVYGESGTHTHDMNHNETKGGKDQ